MKRPLRLLVALLLLAVGSPQARAQLVIIPTFDGSITSDPNASQIEAGINAAIASLDNAIATPITVAINFQESSSGLGGSSTFQGFVPYSDYLSQLTLSATSANDATALASLPVQSNNPVNGDPNIQITLPLARALGFGGADPPPADPFDGTISLNTSIMNLSRTGPQNPFDYDLQSVATHEMDEVLGAGGAGSQLNNAEENNGGVTTGIPVGPLDLFRYSAQGVRSFTTAAGPDPYFSIDGGKTNLVYFDQNDDGSDYADWGNGIPGDEAGNVPPQVQDSFGTPGSAPNLGINELTALDVIGYTLNPTPEPRMIYLLPIGLVTLGIHRRLRKA